MQATRATGLLQCKKSLMILLLSLLNYAVNWKDKKYKECLGGVCKYSDAGRELKFK
jgi:hypothetical protein